MKKHRKNTPDGTFDYIFEQAESLRALEVSISGLYRIEGFREIITPTIEYYDVFDFDGQPIESEDMYKLTDTGGNIAVLRPDNTTPAARVASALIRTHQLPLKLFYRQNIYRADRGYSGKRRESMQCGIEIIGDGGIETDIYCVNMALKSLEATGLDYKAEIGYADYYRFVLRSYGLSDTEIEAVRPYIEARSSAALYHNGLSADLKPAAYAAIKEIPQLFGGAEIIERAKHVAKDDPGASAAVDRVNAIYTHFLGTKYADKIMLDFGTVNKMDYYTGCLINGYVSGAGESVLTGGRYDNLLSNFGEGAPATGFAVDIHMLNDAKMRK